MKNKLWWLFLISLVIIAIIPRGVELFGASYYFGPEQGVEYLVTKSIVVDHKIVLVAHQGGFGGFFKPPGFNYLLAIPFILANGNPYGGRVFMFALSVLTVLLACIVTRKIFGYKTALFTTFFISISPALSHYAGRISPPFIIPILSVCFIYAIFKVFQKKYPYVILAAFIVGFMVNFEMATATTLSIGLFCILLVYCVRRDMPYRYFLFCIGIFFLFVSPLLVYDLSHNSQNLKGILKMLDVAIYRTQGDFSLNFPQIINNRLSTFAWNFYSTFSPQKFVSIPLLVLMFLGVLFYIRDKKNLLEYRLLVWFLAASAAFTFLMLLFYPGDIVQWWIIQLSIFYCYLVGIIAAYFWQKKVFKVFISLFIITFFLAFGSRTYSLFKREFAYPPSSYIIENEPINYIYRNAKGKPFSILVYASRSLKNYEYLIWWYGHTKYHHSPSNSKKGMILYILVENSPGVLPIKLLESLNKGVVVETTKLKYGFIVQKKLL